MGKKKGKGDSRKPKTPTHKILNARKGLIAWFDDFGSSHENDFLSNFYEGKPIVTDIRWGLMFGDATCEDLGIDPEGRIEAKTGEHLFAAFKAADAYDFLEVLDAEGPGVAKSIGRAIKLRDDWETIKYDVMAMVLRLKFTLDREEGQWLLNTGDALLIEGTFWGDKVWGVDLVSVGSDPLKSRGRNWLGTLLMARRAELRAEEMFGHVASTVYMNQAFSL